MAAEDLYREIAAASPDGAESYLLGAAHDSTYSRLHRTTRFCQRDEAWLEGLRMLLEQIGQRSWSYREGQDRSLWVLETSWRGAQEGVLAQDPAAYIRGYFDAEGGVPRDPASRFYVQFVQKDREDLSRLRDSLLRLGIVCGCLHNPSTRVDPDYWRFYIGSASHQKFAKVIGSWHPRKRRLLEARLATGSCYLVEPTHLAPRSSTSPLSRPR